VRRENLSETHALFYVALESLPVDLKKLESKLCVNSMIAVNFSKNL
jgi:hypothetical protein